MQKEFISALVLLIKAFDDGKITSSELKQILSVLIPDDLTLDVKEGISLIRGFIERL